MAIRAAFHRTRLVTALALATLLAALAPTAQAAIWTSVSEQTIPIAGDRIITPHAYRTYAIDLDELRDMLATAPSEVAGVRAAESNTTIDIPMPDGSLATFRVVESPIVAPELAQKYPEIRTYLGQGVTDPTATVRFDVVPQGFHAQIISASGTVYVDPYQRDDTAHYITYHKRDAARAESHLPRLAGEMPTCVLDATDDEIGRAVEIGHDYMARESARTGEQLRTYRVAIGATGEYTSFHGGTVPLGVAAIVTAMNRVNGIYERDVSVRMELIANNDLIVYTNAATDPYTNNNGATMLAENQIVCDGVIGAANYDIGHVFSTGGGGIASLGVVCTNGSKARGVTGLPSPIGDTFYVDYVAHEMGHQYNATHTFNGSAGSCSSNRTATSAFEPGSGSTIMAYAGICSPQNIQFFSDDYFHVISLAQIAGFTQFGGGNICPVTTFTGNTPPVPDASQSVSFTHVPASTPFMLTGSATDVDGDDLTYCWEEYDLGPQGAPNTPSGNAPIFRSFAPTTDLTRVFPRWQDIINGTQTLGEILPTYDRNLRFRFTVRDNAAGGGGHAWNQINFECDATAGPFEVTAPNVAGTISSLSPYTVMWNVANTDNGITNCQSVDILLSTDGGFTYPTVLVAGTPNDGSEDVDFPDINASMARVMVKAADNVFFDISNTNFEITNEVAVGDPVSAPVADAVRLLGNRPNPFNPVTHVSFNLPSSGLTTLRIYDGSGRLVAVLANDVLEAGVHTRSWDGRDLDGRPVASGVYMTELESGGVTDVHRMVLMK
jgi:hypothetical protein